MIANGSKPADVISELIPFNNYILKIDAQNGVQTN